MTGTEQHFHGLPISGGVVLANACLLNNQRHNRMPNYQVDGAGLAREKERVARALAAVTEQLLVIKAKVAERIGAAEAEIFGAQKMIVEDAGLVAKVLGIIEAEKCNAEMAVTSVFDSYETRLRDVDNEFLRERASDIVDIKLRVLETLGTAATPVQCPVHTQCQRGKNRVVVAHELTPGRTLELDAAQVKGFVTERGGKTAHAAILARALGIPAVSGIPQIHRLITCDTRLLVNGDTGDVYVCPSAQTLARFPALAGPVAPEPFASAHVPGLCVMANINLSSDVAEARAVHAEGIGLYRTEFELFAAGRELHETEQYNRYAAVLEAMQGTPVYFRMLDIGGDKAIPFLNLPAEQNPYLGCRGARLLLARQDLFTAQARALARASRHGTVHVMYPMVIDVEQFVLLKHRFAEAVADLPAGTIRHGVMFETPSACLQAPELLALADFGSIGSNDLVQYLFAVDRNNELVAHDYVPDKAVFWALLRSIAQAAAQAGRPLSLCGEIGGDPRYVPKLMEIGIKAVSVSARLIPKVRTAARQVLPVTGT